MRAYEKAGVEAQLRGMEARRMASALRVYRDALGCKPAQALIIHKVLFAAAAEEAFKHSSQVPAGGITAQMEPVHARMRQNKGNALAEMDKLIEYADRSEVDAIRPLAQKLRQLRIELTS